MTYTSGFVDNSCILVPTEDAGTFFEIFEESGRHAGTTINRCKNWVLTSDSKMILPQLHEQDRGYL